MGNSNILTHPSLKNYKVTIISSVYVGKKPFMGQMWDTNESRSFDYFYSCESKQVAVALAEHEHNLPIKETKVIEVDAKFFITVTEYKYGTARTTEIETFDSKEELDAKYTEYLNWFKKDKRTADDKWMLEVVCSDGRNKKANVNL